MIYLHGQNIEVNQDLAITIGKFDGLHKGHIALISELKKVAKSRNLAATVLSFSPHPMAVLKSKNYPLILSQQEKLYLLEQLGLDYYIEFPFTHEFAQTSPESFLEDIIFRQLCGRAMVFGENFRFGEGGRGDMVMAKQRGDGLGLYIHSIPLISSGFTQINSGNIRRLVSSKDFYGISQTCGRDYFLMGKVTHGKKKGREMGFPTANIAMPPDKLLPPIGVYHTNTFVDGKGYASITNINQGLVETHLLHFRGDLYDRIIRVDFLQWMRDMRKFASFDDLAKQLEKDANSRLMLHN
ncbi:MAG: riboflavin biosynthesis protein RibF [Defluviitaleaceae bacterium]|nr:riboflavin biosynthesis protein RibF [Defluviitaleaceae bacterium]